MTVRSPSLARALACLAVALAEAGCAAKRPPPVTVSVVVHGATPALQSIRSGITSPDPAVTTSLAEVPSAAAARPSFADLDRRLAAARAAYVSADFAGCLRGLAGDALLTDLLADEKRVTAARLLFWRAACHAGAGAEADALAEARRIGTLGLEVPAEVSGVSPTVETILARGLREAADAPRVPVRITADVSPASVSVDGRGAACGVPCALDLAPGDHVVRLDADGAVPAIKLVRAAAPASELRVTTTAAAPELAAWQWTARYAARGDVESAASLRLLSTALRAQRLAVIVAEGDPVRLRGVLANGGEIVARAERKAVPMAGAVAAGNGVLHDLLLKGNVLERRPLVKRWEFWAALAAGTALAAGGTAAYLYEPPTRTEVTF